ncbi:MAG: hypothetical protein M0R74_08545 [Dehalococcoidia bacterium]|jgi:hypothetical protein|nr:hypothetical protein [Dehalococcoidia bacterium]
MKKEIFKDDDHLQHAIDGYFDDLTDLARIMQEQIIERNLLYYMGEQYLEYLPSTGQFRRRMVSPFVPTPVSNEIREYVRSVKASLMNQKTVPRVWPNTQEKEDEQGAEAGESLLISMNHGQDGVFFDELEKLCIFIAIAGTVFMRTYPDTAQGAWLPDSDLKTGEVAAKCILPFNVRLDTMGDSLQEKRWVGIQSLKDKEWVEDTYQVKITHKGENKARMDYQRYIAKLVANVSPWKGRPMVVSQLDNEDDDLVLFREVEFKPTPQKRDGFYAVSCGGKVIHTEDRLPIKGTRTEWFYSLTDFHWNYVPGRFWSDAGVSDLISPQNIINEIDQAYAINRKGVGRPRLLTPGEVGLKRIGLGIHGLLAISYNPIMGQKPEIHEGTPLPEQVLRERMLQKEQIQDAAGDPKNVLRGEQPSANASGVLTEGLRETAERGRYPDNERFNRSLTRVHKKRLLIAQEVYTEERIVKTLGRNSKPKVRKFKGSDLHGNTDIRLEPDSSLLQTKAGQTSLLEAMLQSGFFEDGKVSPTIRQEIMKRVGLGSFSDEINNDAERAELENVEMSTARSMEEIKVMLVDVNPETGEEMPLVDDPLFDFDDHRTHYAVHRKYVISPEFRELDGKIQTIITEHTKLHMQRIQAEKPDIREYLQIDKLLEPGLLTESERAQVLEQYVNIAAGKEGMTGLPTSTDVMKIKQKMEDTRIKEQTKQDKIDADIIIARMQGEQKKDALRNQADKGRGEGSKPKSS